jgi:TetR/AcrR family transcriptional regulator
MNNPSQEAGPVVVDSPSDPRQRILEAASRIFAQKGREGARTREIAKAAGVNPAMLHYYFSSKEELYGRVLTPLLDQLLTGLKSALASSRDPRNQIQAVVEFYFNFLGAHSEMPRLIMWEIVTGSDTIHKTLFSMFAADRDDLRGTIRQTFRQTQKRTAKPGNPDQYMISLVALCVFPFIANPVLRAFNPELAHAPDFMEERKSHVLDLLLGSLSPDQP